MMDDAELGNFEDDDYDALNDETFGDVADDSKWDAPDGYHSIPEDMLNLSATKVDSYGIPDKVVFPKTTEKVDYYDGVDVDELFPDTPEKVEQAEYYDRTPVEMLYSNTPETKSAGAAGQASNTQYGYDDFGYDDMNLSICRMALEDDSTDPLVVTSPTKPMEPYFLPPQVANKHYIWMSEKESPGDSSLLSGSSVWSMHPTEPITAPVVEPHTNNTVSSHAFTGGHNKPDPRQEKEKPPWWSNVPEGSFIFVDGKPKYRTTGIGRGRGIPHIKTLAEIEGDMFKSCQYEPKTEQLLQHLDVRRVEMQEEPEVALKAQYCNPSHPTTHVHSNLSSGPPSMTSTPSQETLGSSSPAVMPSLTSVETLVRRPCGRGRHIRKLFPEENPGVQNTANILPMNSVQPISHIQHQDPRRGLIPMGQPPGGIAFDGGAPPLRHPMDPRQMQPQMQPPMPMHPPPRFRQFNGPMPMYPPQVPPNFWKNSPYDMGRIPRGPGLGRWDEHASDRANGMLGRDVDLFSGLMTEKDKQRLRNIQIIQLQNDHPYTADYYFQMKYLKSLKIEPKYRRDYVCFMKLYPATGTEHTRNNYQPTRFENSLGKLQAVSALAPKKAMDLSSVVTAENEGTWLSPSRSLLLAVERVYSKILRVEEADFRATLRNTDDTFFQYRHEDLKAAVKTLNWLGIETVARYNKGKVLLCRTVALIRPTCENDIFRFVLTHMSDWFKEPKEISEAKIVYECVRKATLSARDAELKTIIQVLNPTSSIVESMLGTKIGLSFLLCFLHQVEEVAMALIFYGKQVGADEQAILEVLSPPRISKLISKIFCDSPSVVPFEVFPSLLPLAQRFHNGYLLNPSPIVCNNLLEYRLERHVKDGASVFVSK